MVALFSLGEHGFLFLAPCFSLLKQKCSTLLGARLSVSLVNTISHSEVVRRTQTLFDDARRALPERWSRAALATVCARFPRNEALDAVDTSTPDVRYVLVKSFDEAGFYFYTNFESDKALDLTSTPRASLAFHWWETGVQLRATGAVTRVNNETADAYFASRDRQSQLGAWVSRQSRQPSSPLAERVSEVGARFDDVVPRPAHWGGFLIRPEFIEHWFDRPARLHERCRLERTGDDWLSCALDP